MKITRELHRGKLEKGQGGLLFSFQRLRNVKEIGF
jgi:hypothetical protein